MVSHPMRRAAALVGVLLFGALWCGLQGTAWAQPADAKGGIYTCVDDSGQKRVSERPIAECTDREQRVLNKDGSHKRIVPATLTA